MNFHIDPHDADSSTISGRTMQCGYRLATCLAARVGLVKMRRLDVVEGYANSHR
jgi:hypothetical protein